MALPWETYGGAPLWGPSLPSPNADAAAQEAERQRQAAATEGKYSEYTERKQLESDREFKLKVDAAKRQAETLAITKGQAKATEWYNRQMVQLSKEKFQEDRQQYQQTFAENQRQFNQTFGEGQRQFNVTSSGYLDSGAPTLGRETWQDAALRGWTQDAIRLASTPKSWIDLKRMQSGVSSNIGSIPGLNWASGGQVGNTTFAGQPETNSLGNVMSGLGVNVGQGSSGAGTGSWASQAAQQANQIAAAPLNLNPNEQQIYQTAREFAMNPQGSASGWYENLDPMTRDLIEGAATSQGLDWPSAMSRYKRSRWGGGGSVAAA